MRVPRQATPLPRPWRDANRTTTPTGLFQTSDGIVNLAGGGQEMWQRIVETLDIADAAHDPAFATDALRT